MLVLALDTTTRQGSVALARDGGIIAAFAGDPAITHGERLPGDVMRILDTSGLRLADVDLFAVAAGPGSFTGLRIGIAVMQGFALANEKPLVGISALDATYEAVSAQLSALRPGGDVAIWMDGGRGQVFSAVYRSLDVAEAPLVDKPSEIVARWIRDGSHPAVFAGDGAIAHRNVIESANPDAHIVDPVPPLAPGIARLAELHVRRYGPSPPDAIRPIYVRRPDVELARDRAALAKP
jgi:tRNA threonylcarbamoyladenosine biosynthesis protein TsaB